MASHSLPSTSPGTRRAGHVPWWLPVLLCAACAFPTGGAHRVPQMPHVTSAPPPLDADLREPSASQWAAAPAAHDPTHFAVASGFLQETTPPADRWRFTFIPYLWTANISGNAKVRGFKADVDMSFSDIWDDLDYGLMFAFEARKEDWGLWLDTVYMVLSDDTSVGPINAEWRLRHGYIEGAAFHSLDEERTLDGYVGVRRYVMKAELDLQPGPSPEVDEHWTDVIVGVRKRWQLDPRWSFVLRGDMGGFGIGGDTSDGTYSIQARTRYAMTEMTTWSFGYRYLVVEYDEAAPTYEQDLRYQAIVTGIEFHF